MKITHTPQGIVVTLSKRNLLALLHKVDDPNSARTIESYNAYDEDGNQMTMGDSYFAVVAEPDADHYADRKPFEVGTMHPATEDFIQTNKGTTF